MEREIQLFIAVTIDGFIARENGSLDWLFELANPNQEDHGYNDFIAEIDTIIIGRRTYEQLIGFGIEWPYGNCKTYVATKQQNFRIKSGNTLITNRIDDSFIAHIKTESSKNSWLVGGGDLITQFLNEHAIDRMILSIIPIVLGNGIRLFPDRPKESKFKLVSAVRFETGIVNITYQKV